MEQWIKCNIVAVFSHDLNKLLFCKRSKEPYKGLLNFVGGHVENGEDGLTAAYRELFEETGIPKSMIDLKLICEMKYPFSHFDMQAYAGRLKEDFEVFGDENILFWEVWDKDKDYFSMEKYAGEGSVGHILEQIKLNWSELFT